MSINKHNEIFKLHSNVVRVVGDTAYDANNNEVSYNNDLVTLNAYLSELRLKRNFLLQQTDYLALSDQTMSAEMTTYRQALRDITNGLTTVEQVEAVVFPEKPEV
jgi:hypothetical protein